MPHAPVSIEDRLEKLSVYSEQHSDDLTICYNSTEGLWQGYFDSSANDDHVHEGTLEEVIDALEAEARI